jgi:hypothetical protein
VANFLEGVEHMDGVRISYPSWYKDPQTERHRPANRESPPDPTMDPLHHGP